MQRRSNSIYASDKKASNEQKDAIYQSLITTTRGEYINRSNQAPLTIDTNTLILAESTLQLTSTSTKLRRYSLYTSNIETGNCMHILLSHLGMFAICDKCRKTRILDLDDQRYSH